MAQKVLLGMSGGVDSSVAALLLQKQGYQVIGATMNLWPSADGFDRNAEDAEKVCQKLGISHYVFDFSKQFANTVVADFVENYRQCRTPNPCIVCNEFFKFGAMAKEAEKLGAELIATGHYARCEYDAHFGQTVIKMSDSGKKDQTYVLYRIHRDLLSKIIFPLSNFQDKAQIRKIAEEYHLINANRPDSQDICFIPNGNYKQFLEGKVSSEPGDIVDMQGHLLGKHAGLIHYTVGQRKGLGISAAHPLFVVKLDQQNNQLVVGENSDLFSKELFAEALNWHLFEELKEPLRVQAKIRYAAPAAEAVVSPYENGVVQVVFDEPQRAVTPGQSVVFYLGDVLIGGGLIFK